VLASEYGESIFGTAQFNMNTVCFLWANGDGTVSLELADNRVSVSVVEWQIPRQGMDLNCHYYGYRQDPSDTPLPVSVSLGSPP